MNPLNVVVSKPDKSILLRPNLRNVHIYRKNVKVLPFRLANGPKKDHFSIVV